MNAPDFAGLLKALLNGIKHGDETEIDSVIGEMSDFFSDGRIEIQSFQDAGLMTRDEGVAISQHGSRLLEITVVQVGGFDSDDED